MKSAILVLVLISLIGCTESRKTDNEPVKYEIKTFFIGNTDQIEEKEQLLHNISNEQKTHIPMHNSRIYDPLFLSNDKNIPQKEPINLKASKIITLGKEEIKLFDKHSPIITVDEIKKLRAQTN
jgi:hypothetical protein